MLVALLAVVVIFFVARYFATLGLERAAYLNVAGASAVVFFGLGIWAGFALFSSPPAPPVAVSAPVAPAVPAPATPKPIVMSRAAIAGLTVLKGGAPAVAAIDAITAYPAGGNTPVGSAFTAGAPLFVFGWAGSSANKPFDILVVAIDGHPRFAGTAGYGGPRPDVAAALKAPAMQNSGISAVSVSTAGLSKGPHTLQVGGLTSDRKHFELAPVVANFTLQ